MRLNDLQPAHALKKSRKIGRGGRRGKTSGRGHKGQKARAGAKIRPAVRDLIKKIPKLRGATAPKRDKACQAINLRTLDSSFAEGDRVSPLTLRTKGLITGRAPAGGIKILADGELSQKLIIEGCAVSVAARDKIEQAGGEVK